MGPRFQVSHEEHTVVLPWKTHATSLEINHLFLATLHEISRWTTRGQNGENVSTSNTSSRSRRLLLRQEQEQEQQQQQQQQQR
ncbi:hypothetical protein M0802_003946 [Mischocyttarus mexicanus]|nr:hypothetical protein M0802_003946 [Mischocyttarus mexicanus]